MNCVVRLSLLGKASALDCSPPSCLILTRRCDWNIVINTTSRHSSFTFKFHGGAFIYLPPTVTYISVVLEVYKVLARVTLTPPAMTLHLPNTLRTAYQRDQAFVQSRIKPGLDRLSTFCLFEECESTSSEGVRSRVLCTVYCVLGTWYGRTHAVQHTQNTVMGDDNKMSKHPEATKSSTRRSRA